MRTFARFQWQYITRCSVFSLPRESVGSLPREVPFAATSFGLRPEASWGMNVELARNISQFCHTPDVDTAIDGVYFAPIRRMTSGAERHSEGLRPSLGHRLGCTKLQALVGHSFPNSLAALGFSV